MGCIAADTETILLKVRKYFEIQWVFSTFTVLRAHLKDFSALHAHLTALSENVTRFAKEASKCKGKQDVQLVFWEGREGEGRGGEGREVCPA